MSVLKRYNGTTWEPVIGASSGIPASAVSVAASGFSGNLSPTDTNLQLVAQKVDDLVLGGEGAIIIGANNILPVNTSTQFVTESDDYLLALSAGANGTTEDSQTYLKSNQLTLQGVGPWSSLFVYGWKQVVGFCQDYVGKTHTIHSKAYDGVVASPSITSYPIEKVYATKAAANADLGTILIENDYVLVEADESLGGIRRAFEVYLGALDPLMGVEPWPHEQYVMGSMSVTTVKVINETECYVDIAGFSETFNILRVEATISGGDVHVYNSVGGIMGLGSASTTLNPDPLSLGGHIILGQNKNYTWVEFRLNTAGEICVYDSSFLGMKSDPVTDDLIALNNSSFKAWETEGINTTNIVRPVDDRVDRADTYVIGNTGITNGAGITHRFNPQTQNCVINVSISNLSNNLPCYIVNESGVNSMALTNYEADPNSSFNNGAATITMPPNSWGMFVQHGTAIGSTVDCVASNIPEIVVGYFEDEGISAIPINKTYSELKAMVGTGAQTNIVGFAKRYGTVVDTVFVNWEDTFVVGDTITITGTASNNGTYTVGSIVGENLSGYENYQGLDCGLSTGWSLAGAVGVISNVVAGTLVPGQRYRITDYATTYVIDAGGAHTNNFTGDLEPLIVTAVSTDALDIVAISELHSRDIIHYSINYMLEKYGSVSAYTKGKILYREDPALNVIAHDDFRNYWTRLFKEETTGLFWLGNNVGSIEGFSQKVPTESIMMPMFNPVMLNTQSVHDVYIENQNGCTLPFVFYKECWKLRVGGAMDACIVLGVVSQVNIGSCSNVVCLGDLNDADMDIGGTRQILNIGGCNGFSIFNSQPFTTTHAITNVVIGPGYSSNSGIDINDGATSQLLGPPQSTILGINKSWNINDGFEDTNMIGITTNAHGAYDGGIELKAQNINLSGTSLSYAPTTLAINNFTNITGIKEKHIYQTTYLDSRAYSNPAVAVSGIIIGYWAATKAEAISLAATDSTITNIVMVEADESLGNRNTIYSFTGGVLSLYQDPYVPSPYYASLYNIFKIKNSCDCYIDISGWVNSGELLRIEALGSGGQVHVYSSTGNFSDVGINAITLNPDTNNLGQHFILGDGDGISWIEFKYDGTSLCVYNSSRLGYKYDPFVETLGTATGTTTPDIGIDMAMCYKLFY